MLDIEKAKSLILIPDFKKYAGIETDWQLLASAIVNVKIAQMISLAQNIHALLDSLVEFDQSTLQKIISLITVESAKNDQQKLMKIFELNANAEEKDEELEEELKALGLPDIYIFLYRFRHQYFLNKPFKLKENLKAFTQKLSESLLAIGHSYISRYLLQKPSNVTDDEFRVLTSFYPKSSLGEKRFRRQAHADISLTLPEIQNLIRGALFIMWDLKKIPDVLWPIPMSEDQLVVYRFYTKSQEILQIKNNDLAYFIKGFENFRNSIDYSTGISLLSYAVIYKRYEFVQYFLSDKGANPNYRDHQGFTALHYAVLSDDLKIIQLLLSSKKCNVNFEDNGFYTPIYLAAEMGNVDIVVELLNHGADPNLARNRYLSTACHVAVRNNHYGVVAILLTSKKVNIDLLDANRQTPTMIAQTLNDKDKKIYQLLVKYKNSDNNNTPATPVLPNNALATSTPPKTLAFPKKSQVTSPLVNTNPLTPTLSSQVLQIQSQVLNQLRIDKIQGYLLNPKENKNILNHLIRIFKTENNIFPLTNQAKSQPVVTITQDFFKRFSEQSQPSEEVKLSFQNYASAIENIHKEKLTFAQAYYKIIKIIDSMLKEKYHFSFAAIAFEIYKQGFLEHLINLQDKKTNLQVAIEDEDVLAIKQILTEEPVRDLKVLYKQREITELDYAIQLGKVISVETMLEVASNNKNVNLGPAPENPLSLVKERNRELGEMNQSFREAEEFFDIDIPKSSEKNIIRLFRQLANSIPKGNDRLINHFYTQGEYPLVRVLIAQKEKVRSAWKIRKDHSNAVNYLNKRKEALLQNPNQHGSSLVSVKEELELIEKGLQFLSTDSSLPTKLARRKVYKVGNDEPRTESIYKHATSNYQIIAETKKMVTVDDAIRIGNVRSATPLGARKVSYYGVGGRLASITPLRRTNASHIIELKITELLDKKLLDQQDLFTSPHISAFKVERVEKPIIFIGDNPNIKAVLRIYHFREKGKDLKAYRYDHYLNNEPCQTHYEVYSIEEEYYIGDNIKLLAARFIHHIRNLKGNFDEGTYYHYILKNYTNLDVVESAWAAFFNVLNIEGKISKDIPIDHPKVLEGWKNGVRVIKNPEMNLSTHLLLPDAKALESYVIKNQFQEFVQFVESRKIGKQQLGNVLIQAVKLGREQFVSSLLNLGVGAVLDFKCLDDAIKNLAKAYLKNARKIQAEEVKVAFNILNLLLNYGSADINDPAHIRYGNSADSLSSNSSWGNVSSTDFLELMKFILRFDEISIQRLILSASSKHLQSLYSFTFAFCFFGLHEYIAERLSARRQYVDTKEKELKLYKVDSRLQQEECKDLLKYVDNNDYQSISNILQQSFKTEIKDYYFVLTYAIKKGKLDVVVACYDFFKSTEFSNLYSPLHLALRCGQTEIVKKLIELGADLNKKNILGESAADVAFLYNCSDEVLDLLIDASSAESALIAAINNEKYHLVPKLAKRFKPDLRLKNNEVAFLRLKEGENYLRQRLTTLVAAIEKGHLPTVELIYEAYQAKYREAPNDLSDILGTILEVALEEKQEAIFVYLVQEIVKSPKILNILFIAKDKYFLAKIILKGTSKFVELCITHLGPDAAKVVKATNEHYHHALHIALLAGDIEKIKLIRSRYPKLGYVTNKINAAGVIRIFAGIPEEEAIFDHIMKDGFVFSQTDKIQALAEALIKGQLKIIEKLFDYKILDPKYLSEDRENLLQLIFAFLKNAPMDNLYHHWVNPDKFKGALNFLCVKYLMDVNHKDSNNHCLILNPKQNITCLNIFQAFLIENNKTNFLVKDDNNRTPLHLLYAHEKAPELLVQYLAQGGDINAVSKKGFTAFEMMLINSKHIPTDIIKKMKQLNAKASTFLPALNITLGIVTCTYQKENYVLVRDNFAFIHEMSKDQKAHNFVSAGSNSLINFRHLDKGVYGKLPSAGKILAASSGSYHWAKMPTSFTRVADDIYKVSIEKQEYEVSALVKELLEYIINAKPTSISSKEKDDNQYNYIVAPEKFTIWQKIAQKLQANLEACYKGLFTLQTYENATRDIWLSKFKTSIKLAGFPFQGNIYNGRKPYELVYFYSPLAAALFSSDKNVLTSFIRGGEKPSFSDGKNSPFILAIRFEKPEALQILFASVSKLKGDDFVLCVNELSQDFDPTYLEDIKLLRCILENTNKCTLGVRHYAKIQKFCKQMLDIGEEVNEYAQEIKEIETLLEKIKPVNKKQPTKSKGGKRKVEETEENSEIEDSPVASKKHKPNVKGSVTNPSMFFGKRKRGNSETKKEAQTHQKSSESSFSDDSSSEMSP